MGKFIDLTGNRYGRLVVLNYVIPKSNPIQWVCLCDCGSHSTVSRCNLTQKHTRSCGCLNIERAIETNTTHGTTVKMRRPHLYNVWAGMRQRCIDKNSPSYPDYGGRGISIDSSWQDFKNFRDWALNNGYKKSLTIERKDVNLGYCPSNCSWETRIIQARNRRPHKETSSKFIGVSLKKTTGNWEALITVDKQRIRLGTFTSELVAAEARDAYIKNNKLKGFMLNFT